MKTAGIMIADSRNSTGVNCHGLIGPWRYRENHCRFSDSQFDREIGRSLFREPNEHRKIQMRGVSRGAILPNGLRSLGHAGSG